MIIPQSHSEDQQGPRDEELKNTDSQMSLGFPTMWYVRPAKAQTSLRIRTVWSEPLFVAWIFYEY